MAEHEEEVTKDRNTLIRSRKKSLIVNEIIFADKKRKKEASSNRNSKK